MQVRPLQMQPPALEGSPPGQYPSSGTLTTSLSTTITLTPRSSSTLRSIARLSDPPSSMQSRWWFVCGHYRWARFRVLLVSCRRLWAQRKEAPRAKQRRSWRQLCRGRQRSCCSSGSSDCVESREGWLTWHLRGQSSSSNTRDLSTLPMGTRQRMTCRSHCSEGASVEALAKADPT